MKKWNGALSVMALLLLSACATPLHTNVKGANVDVANVEAIPMEVGIKVGEKISGTCESSTFLIFNLKSPSKLAYGVEFDEGMANYGGECTEGAVYNALTSANADTIVAPRFFTEGNTFLCLPFLGCLYRDVTVTVTGFKGTYEEFKKIDPELRKAKIQTQKSDKSSLTPNFLKF